MLGPNGKAFKLAGCGVFAESDVFAVAATGGGATLAGQMRTLLPGMNICRLAHYNPYFLSHVPADYAPFINSMTSNGVVCVIDFHWTQGASTLLSSGSTPTLAQALTFYTNMAAFYKNNPLVWYQTENEPYYIDAPVQQQIYNTIRGQGVSAPIILEAGQVADNRPDSLQSNPGTDASVNAPTLAIYAAMTNVIWDNHVYNDGATVGAMQSYLAFQMSDWNQITSKDGRIPTACIELGNNPPGPGTAANAQVQVAFQYGATNSSWLGACAWIWNANNDGTNLDVLTNNYTLPSTPTLTAFGTQIATFIAAGPGPYTG